MAALSEVVDLIMGQSPPSSTYNEASDGLAFFQGKADFGFRYPTPRLFCNAPLKIAKPHDILMSVRAPVGPTNIADRECCIGRGLAAIRPRTIDGDFLFFNLRYIEKFIASLGSGSTFHAINKTQLGSVEVNMHDFGLPEQRKIAGVLGVVQRAIEQQERLLQLTTELKKTLLHQLFTQGLRGEPQKQTEIGPVPESWAVKPLGNYLTEAQYGISVKGAQTGRYAVLRMTNQQQGRISGANLQYVELTPAQFAKFRVERQDILFNRTNSLELVGRTAIFDLEGDFVFASYLIRLRTDAARLRPCFLNHYFNWDETQVRLKSIATRAVSQSNISATRLRGFPVPVPSPEEQDEIVTNIDCVDRKLTAHRRKHAAFTALFRTLLHQLMTAQLRVHDIDLPELETTTQG